MSNRKIGDVFDELQELYTQKMIGWVPFYLDTIQQMIPSLQKGISTQKILDLGAGNGNIAAILLQKYPLANLRLVDASIKMLDACRDRFSDYPNVSYQHDLMQKLNLPENEFDLVTASYSLHHVEDVLKAEIIKHIHQWTKPGGHFSYLDLFIDRSDSTYPDLIKFWKEFVIQRVGKESWEELFDHHQRYDYPCNLSNTTKWLQEAGFSKITYTIKEKYWVHILATV